MIGFTSAMIGRIEGKDIIPALDDFFEEVLANSVRYQQPRQQVREQLL